MPSPLFPPPPLLKLCGGTADATPAFVVGLLKSEASDFVVTEVNCGGDLVPYHPGGGGAGDIVVDPCLDDVRALDAAERPPAKRRVAPAGGATDATDATEAMEATEATEKGAKAEATEKGAKASSSLSSSASPLWGRFPFVVAGADGPEQQFRDMFGAPAFDAAAALHERCKVTDETSSGAPPPPLAETLDLPLLPGDDTPEKRGKCHALVRALWPALKADRLRADQESRAGSRAGGAGGVSGASCSNTSTSSAVVALDVVGGGGGGAGGGGGISITATATAGTAATGMRLTRNDLFDRMFYTGKIGKPRTADSELESGTTRMDAIGTGNDAGDTGTTVNGTGTGTGTDTGIGTGTGAAGVGGAGGVGSGREKAAVRSMAGRPPGATLKASEVFRLQTYKANGAMHPSAKDGVVLMGRESKGDRTRLHQALARRCPYVVEESTCITSIYLYYKYLLVLQVPFIVLFSV